LRFLENIIEVFFTIDIDTHDPQEVLRPLQSCSIPELDEVGASYEQVEVPEDGFYLALDTNYQRIFALFSNPYSLVFGTEIGQQVRHTTTENIHRYTLIQPPSLPHDQAPHHYKELIPLHPKQDPPPTSLYGVYHWGVWMKPDHENRPLIFTPDTTNPAARVQPQLQALFQSFGNITQVKSVLLGAIDREQRDLMRSTVSKLRSLQSSLWKTSPKECFALRTCSVNVFPRPHISSSDMDWAMLAALGNFGGGQFCIADLKRSISYPAGSIGGIRPGHLVHFARMWEGSRTCLVSTVPASLLSWVSNNPTPGSS